MAEPFVLVAHLSAEQQRALHAQVAQMDWPQGAEIKAAERYHVTVLYSKKGDEHSREWLTAKAGEHDCFEASVAGIEMFTNPGQYAASPIVLTLDAPDLTEWAEALLDEAVEHGLEPSRFDNKFNAHIKVGIADALPQGTLPSAKLTLGGLGFWA